MTRLGLAADGVWGDGVAAVIRIMRACAVLPTHGPAAPRLREVDLSSNNRIRPEEHEELHRWGASMGISLCLGPGC